MSACLSAQELGRAPSESYVAEASKEADALDSLLGK